jgi:hypothetical protein
MVMKQNGNTGPAKIGPVPSTKRVTAGRRIVGCITRMPTASAATVPSLTNVDR